MKMAWRARRRSQTPSTQGQPDSLVDVHTGMYGIILSSKLIIPNWTDLVNGDEVEEDLAEEEEELPESPTWAPNTWKRAHWLCGRGVLFGCLRVVGGSFLF